MYKVMVVDNESIIRKGLLCLINWSSLDCEVVYEAIDGIAALNHLEKNHIDIVVTDIRMPEMDGIELSKSIYENYPHIKVIILTAYPDFSYAHYAIQYNVVDFVIKTGYIEKLPDAVQKAVNLLKEQDEKKNKLKHLEETISKNQNALFENFVKDIMNGVFVNIEQMNTKFDENNLHLQNFFIISYEIVPIEYDHEKTIILEDQNRFILAVKNFLFLALKDYNYITVIMDKNHLVTLITFNNHDYLSCSKKLFMTCSEILSMVEGFMQFTTNVGISGMHHSASELLTAYNESLEAHWGNFYNENHLSMYLSEKGPQSAISSAVIHQFIDDIIEYIKQHKPEAAKDKLHQLFEAFKTSKLPIEKVTTSSMLFCSACLRLANNLVFSESENGQKEADIYKRIQLCKSLKGLQELLSDIIQSTFQQITIFETELNLLVQKVNLYIQKNYQNPISLQSIADSLYVNSSYLSSLYKKETGSNIIDALNKHRIEVAKKLLRDPSAKIFEVGLSVGIEDPKYFTHVFTKYVGLSPKQYKSSLI